jgi:hypothetical protein
LVNEAGAVVWIETTSRTAFSKAVSGVFSMEWSMAEVAGFGKYYYSITTGPVGYGGAWLPGGLVSV